jgi:hypothetical protein
MEGIGVFTIKGVQKQLLIAYLVIFLVFYSTVIDRLILLFRLNEKDNNMLYIEWCLAICLFFINVFVSGMYIIFNCSLVYI